MITQKLASDIDALGVDVFSAQYNENTAISCQDYNCIGIDDRGLLQSEMHTILAHEMGHFLSGAFYKGASPYELREQAEHRANATAFNRYLPYKELCNAMNDITAKPWELADYFGVLEVVIVDAYHYYKDVLGYEF